MPGSARRWLLAAIFIAVTTAIGCEGGGKSSGKYSNLDKPKPVEGQK